jgi:glycosyltransferase involved in cell wall biosynthesis
MTDSLGQSQVLPYLQKLSKKGCEFHIISLEKELNFQENKEEIRNLCDKYSIKWHPLPYTSKVPVLSAFGNYKTLKNKAISLQKEVVFDIAHCRSDIPGIIGQYLQKKWGVKFLFDIRGFWADERVEGGIWNKSNPIFNGLYHYFKRVETRLFKDANAIVSLTEKGKKIISQMPALKGSMLKITVIPCCVDLDAFSKGSIDLAKQKTLHSTLDIDEKSTIIGYLGSIGTWYMLEEMLMFYAEIRKDIEKPVFFFLSGEKEENIISTARKYNIPNNEIIVKRARHSDVPLYVSLFDYSVFFIRPTFSKSASSPTKKGELMAMEIPIICNSGVGDTDEIINRYQAGKVISELNQSAFSKFNLDTIKFDPKSARQGAEEWFSLEKGSERYFKIYQRILK